MFVLMVVTGLTHLRCVMETTGKMGNVGPLKYNKRSLKAHSCYLQLL